MSPKTDWHKAQPARIFFPSFSSSVQPFTDWNKSRGSWLQQLLKPWPAERKVAQTTISVAPDTPAVSGAVYDTHVFFLTGRLGLWPYQSLPTTFAQSFITTSHQRTESNQ
jgi:hypothetical protein